MARFPNWLVSLTRSAFGTIVFGFALKRVSDLRYALTLAAAALAFCGSASATLLDRGPDMVYDPPSPSPPACC
jgi:hypothetical protein